MQNRILHAWHYKVLPVREQQGHHALFPFEMGGYFKSGISMKNNQGSLDIIKHSSSQFVTSRCLFAVYNALTHKHDTHKCTQIRELCSNDLLYLLNHATNAATFQANINANQRAVTGSCV